MIASIANSLLYKLATRLFKNLFLYLSETTEDKADNRDEYITLLLQFNISYKSIPLVAYLVDVVNQNLNFKNVGQ